MVLCQQLTRDDLPEPTLPMTHSSSPALTLKLILLSVKPLSSPSPCSESSEEPGSFTWTSSLGSGTSAAATCSKDILSVVPFLFHPCECANVTFRAA